MKDARYAAKTIIAFDPAWSGKSGWAVLRYADLEILQVASGTFRPHEKWKGVYRNIYIANQIKENLSTVISATASEFPDDEIIIAYESPLEWIVNAARRKKRNTRRPFSAASVRAIIMPIPILWNVISENADRVTSVLEASAMKARRDMGVKSLSALYQQEVTALARAKSYDGEGKAAVGVAVMVLLAQDGWVGYQPPTDHEADAMLIALWARSWLDAQGG